MQAGPDQPKLLLWRLREPILIKVDDPWGGDSLQRRLSAAERTDGRGPLGQKLRRSEFSSDQDYDVAMVIAMVP